MTTFDKSPSVKIKLEFPIEIDGDIKTELTMRRPKVRDTLDANKAHPSDASAVGMFVLARLCNVTPEHIAELDEYDAGVIQAQYERFRGGALVG